MSLRERIDADMKDALRARNAGRLGAIRLLRAALQRREVDERRTLDDAGAMEVINSLIKQGRDARDQFARAGRDELARTEDEQIEVYRGYLPPALADGDLDALIDTSIRESGATTARDMGRVMAALRATVAGRADMAVVSARVKARLQGA